jgi:hypothetical protein
MANRNPIYGQHLPSVVPQNRVDPNRPNPASLDVVPRNGDMEGAHGSCIDDP